MHINLHTEMEWERAMLQLGAELWDERNAKAPFIQTQHGRRFIKHTIDEASKAIEGFRKENLSSGRCKAAFMWLNCLEGETIALYVLGHMAGITIDHNCKGYMLPGAGMQKLAKRVSKSIADEINLRFLISRSKDETERWKKENGIEANVLSLAERTLRSDGYNRRTYYRLRKLYEDVDSCEMSEEDSIRLGAELIQLMVETFPDYWVIDTKLIVERGQPKRTTVLLMTESFRQDIESVMQQYRVVQAQLLPTLMPPKKW